MFWEGRRITGEEIVQLSKAQRHLSKYRDQLQDPGRICDMDMEPSSSVQMRSKVYKPIKH